MKYINKELYVLESPATYQQVSEDEFRALILQQGKPAIVTFLGEWMGSAAMLRMIIEDLCEEYRDQLSFFCVSLEKLKLIAEFGIQNTATVCFFHQGQIIDQQVGLVSKIKLRQKIEEFLKTLS